MCVPLCHTPLCPTSTNVWLPLKPAKHINLAMVGIPQQQRERATTATTTTMRNFIAKPQTLRIRNVSRTAMHFARRGKVEGGLCEGGSAVKLRMLQADNSTLTASRAQRMPTDSDSEQQFAQAILTLSLSNVNGLLEFQWNFSLTISTIRTKKKCVKIVNSKEDLSTVWKWVEVLGVFLKT